MNWKTRLCVADLPDNARLELTCRKCGHVRYITRPQLMARRGAHQLHLDEVERRAQCRQQACKGLMRMAYIRDGDTSGFVGGLA